jgi:hypothetical protein
MRNVECSPLAFDEIPAVFTLDRGCPYIDHRAAKSESRLWRGSTCIQKSFLKALALDFARQFCQQRQRLRSEADAERTVSLLQAHYSYDYEVMDPSY